MLPLILGFLEYKQLKGAFQCRFGDIGRAAAGAGVYHLPSSREDIHERCLVKRPV
jgi:hypothetical protein